MTVAVRAVANELLDLAADASTAIDPLQMQKLLYLAQGWTLGLSGDRLFPDLIEAWEYGPVVPDIYHALKLFGAAPIRGRLNTFDRARRQIVTARDSMDDLEGDIVRAVWKKYGHWAGPQLIALTHLSVPPWWRSRM